MDIVNANSLGDTIDALNEAEFADARLPAATKKAAAAWIASRQGLPGAYAGMFAPTEADMRSGITLYCGDRVKTRAATAHILGEEACRALIVLDVPCRAVKAALQRANEGMLERLEESERLPNSRPGMYCCHICTCSLWRHLAAGGLTEQERRLSQGLAILKSRRSDNGRWHSFPFYYTLLALTGIDLPAAREELRYAAPACERMLNRIRPTGKHGRRRKALLERVTGI